MKKSLAGFFAIVALALAVCVSMTQEAKAAMWDMGVRGQARDVNGNGWANKAVHIEITYYKIGETTTTTVPFGVATDATGHYNGSVTCAGIDWTKEAWVNVTANWTGWSTQTVGGSHDVPAALIATPSIMYAQQP